MTYCEPSCSCCPTSTTDAAILVTINPEARVSAERTSASLSQLRPGEWAAIPVSVLNEGYVTGPLQIRWLDVPGVEVEVPTTELTGARVQDTHFRIRLIEAGNADLTLRFWALGALGGLANKNTTSLYLRCGT